MAKLTIVGMYNYDQTLFNGLTFPTGIDKDIAVNEILMRSGEFCALYTDPTFMKIQIGIWGQKHYRTFEKWIEALSVQYNPLENYDRTEEMSETTTRAHSLKTEANYNDDRTLDLTDEQTPDLTDELTHDTESKRTADLNEKTTNNTTDTNAQMFNGKDETSVSAYDSSTYSPKEKVEHDMGTVELQKTGTVDLDTTGTDTYTVTGTDTTTHTGTDTTTHSGTDKRNVKGTLSDSLGTENGSIGHESHIHGNIGVTTSQQMLQAELDVQRWNIYEHIADIFVDEFCIMIY